ncbi:MAG: hypothetical protein R3338_14160 [Thermoanaerobaculia bacterium]|nr:hypothetical protein [Thermoanaerobaculia bacterium]
MEAVGREPVVHQKQIGRLNDNHPRVLRQPPDQGGVPPGDERRNLLE